MAHAQRRQFDVPEDAASAGINEFARQSGLQILVAQAAVANRRTHAVQGLLDVHQALAQLLEGSGLAIRSESPRAIILGVAETTAPSAAAPAIRTRRELTGGTTAEVRLEEIIVTAERREQIEERTPMSISVIPYDDMVQMGRYGVIDALRNVPSVQIKIAQPSPLIAVRGLGTALPPNITENAVAFTYDGVATTLPLNALGLFDLNRIEVLRGPQGTLYGRNATAGVINLVANDPVLHEASGRATIDVGDYAFYRAELVSNVPLNDEMALRVAFSGRTRSDYYDDNRHQNTAYALRTKWLYAPSDEFSLMLAAELSASTDPEQQVTTIPYEYWISGDYYRNQDRLAHGDASLGKLEKFYGKLNWEVGPGQITLTPGYFKQASYSAINFDGMQAPQRREVLPREQHSYELRYSALPEAAVQWATGYFHFHAEELGARGIAGGVRLNDGTQVLAPDGYTYICLTPAPSSLSDCTLQALQGPQGAQNPQLDSRTTDAIFGQLTYPLDSKWQVLGGLRASQDVKRAFDVTNRIQTSRTHNVDWRLGVQYQRTPTAMLYTTLASGYRPGGIVPFAAFNPPGSPTSFKKEVVTALEVGSKNRLWNDRVIFNADAYYYDYRDYQANDFYEVNGGPPNGGVVSIAYNVPKVRIDGLELELQSLLSAQDRLNIALAYNDSRILSDFYWHPAGVTEAVNYRGHPLTQSAKWNGSLTYQHDFVLRNHAKLSTRVDYRHIAGQFLNLNQQTPGLYSSHANSYSPANSTADISLTYQPLSSHWNLNFYVKNLTNEVVIVGWQEGPDLLSIDAPRTFAAQLNLNF